MDEIKLLIGMILVVLLTALVIWREMQPKRKPPNIEADIKRSWEEFLRNQRK